MCATARSDKNNWLLIVVCLLLVTGTALGQVPQTTRQRDGTSRPPEPTRPQTQDPQKQQTDDIVRVFTELVQTDVMVFDKDGHFVNGLRPENFELRIDGKLRPIQSFEQITAGSSEEAQLAAARGVAAEGRNPKAPVPLDRGRTIFFYVDDLHLDPAGWSSAQKLMTSFVDNNLGQNDEIAITSPSGQIGFLQQLTENQIVLHRAIKRLSPRSVSVTDGDRPRMNEYQALMIEKNDFDMVGYFVDETLKFNPGLERDVAAHIVSNRANAILSQTSYTANITLSGLEGVIRSVKNVPGRKIVFFISNGFVTENRHSDSLGRIRQLTSAAAKAGVVIYSIDMRGLIAPFGNAEGLSFDPTGRLERASAGEILASQDAMNALARDTGGKPIFNTNDFKPGVVEALKETSVYYLLVWKPEKSGGSASRFRNIDVKIIGRPELTVRVRRGFFDVDPAVPATVAAKPEDPIKAVAAALRDVLVAPYPENKLPVSLSLDYHDVVAKGPVLSASVQVPGEFMVFGPEGDKTQALLDVAGAFYNEEGKPTSTFFERIVTTALTPEAARGEIPDITYTYPAVVAPGLYQARVVVRDYRSGRAGSARAWIEIPDLTTRQFALSSLLLGERTQPSVNVADHPDDIRPVALSATHRFRHESVLRFLVFLYNAELSATDKKPDAAIQMQIVRDDQPVMTTTLRRVSTDGVADTQRIPYAAEVPLNSLTPGRYLLVVSVIDRVSKKSASQQTHFEVYYVIWASRVRTVNFCKVYRKVSASEDCKGCILKWKLMTLGPNVDHHPA
ncbi:MAG: VWA domain-containing protein, partial [Pyrinomonadaceae bacterium]